MPSLSVAQFRSLSVLLLFFTGACGLIYEVTWFKYLANLIGSEARASALILSVFLGGLAIGYALFGRVSAQKSSRALVKLTGWLEIGIGVWAILFPSLYMQTWDWVSATFSGDLNIIAEICIASLLILPPTILMGGTLPLLTQALSLSVRESDRIHAAIYAANTAGAFLGCLLAGFYLIPHFGLPITMILTACLNFIAGIAFVGMGTYVEIPSQPTAKTSNSETKFQFIHFLSDRKIATAHVLALLCGFIAITLQTALMRLVGLTAGSSEYAFAIVVSVFILMLAWGSYRVASRPQSRLNLLWINQLTVFLGLILIFWLIPELPYFLHVIRALLTTVSVNFYIFQILLFLAFTLLLVVPVHAMGRSMPLLFAGTSREVQDLGQHVGTLYFANTLGCVLGGLIGGYALYYVVNIDRILLICEGLALLTLMLAFFLSSVQNKKILATIALVVGIGVISFSPHWEQRRFAVGTFRLRSPVSYSFRGARFFYENYEPTVQMVYRRDGPTSSMSVMQSVDDKGERVSRSIFVNGKSDGDTLGDRSTTQLIGHLPALLTTVETKTVAVIGFGTGMTAGSLSIHPQVQEIDIFEISPLVREYAPLFDFANHAISKNPKVRWEIGDAYQKLRTSSRKYSVICSEPSNPWVLGVERLYSQEFLNLAKQHLEPGGIYAQWIHSYDISESTLALVINTYASVFKHIRVFQVGKYDIALLGSDTKIGDHNIAALEQKLRAPSVREDLEQINIKTPSDLLALELLWPKEAFANGGLHSLEFPKLAYAAGYDFFMATSFDIPTLQDQPWMRVWSQFSFAMSLAESLHRTHRTPETLKDLVKAWCHMEKIEFGPNWRTLTRSCRQGLAMAVQARILDNKGGFMPWELEVLMLRAASPSRGIATTKWSPQEVENRLHFIEEYSAAFPDLQAREILNLGASCGRDTDSIKCKAQMVSALATFGAWREAEAEFNALLELKVPGPLRTFLQSKILQSKRANSAETDV